MVDDSGSLCLIPLLIYKALKQHCRFEKGGIGLIPLLIYKALKRWCGCERFQRLFDSLTDLQSSQTPLNDWA